MKEKICLESEKKQTQVSWKTDFFGKIIIKASRYLEVLLKLKMWENLHVQLRTEVTALRFSASLWRRPYQLYAVVLN